MSVVSNNLANASTVGFKKDRAIFEDLLYQNIRQVGANSSQDTLLPSGMQVGTGVRVSASEKLFTQGNLLRTENALDMAVQGHGFFQILMPDGTMAYTRDGTFQVNEQGQLVTSSGYPLQPAISIPDDALSVTIGVNGTVSVLSPGSAATTQVGDVQLADFVNPAGLQAIGQNLYLESAASGAPQTGGPGVSGFGTIQQGFVESSNVNVVEELVGMIEAQRAYEMNSKAISAADGMMQNLTNTV